jgi:hypothetical protein
MIDIRDSHRYPRRGILVTVTNIGSPSSAPTERNAVTPDGYGAAAEG